MNAKPHPPYSAAVAWLLTDQTLAAAMTVLVKKGGADFPPVQMVFIRSLIGLLCVLPLAWREWESIRATTRIGRHVLRVSCNAAALIFNWAALTALPLATANAIGFTRPLVVMVLSIIFLSEHVTRWRWASALIGLCGVLLIISPQFTGQMTGSLWGFGAALGAVAFGSLAVIQTRALAAENTTVLMVFYTVGLTAITAVPAYLVWKPVGLDQLPLLICIGVLAQTAQYCFLRAYQMAPANKLAGIGYISIVFATVAGFVFFDEIPRWTTYLGASVIIGALLIARRMDRS